MIDVRNGAISFVFANEDTYLLPGLVEMDLYQYLCYQLYAQGMEHIYILRAGADGYYLDIADREAERLLNETRLPGLRLWGKYGRSYSRARRERIDWDCDDLDDLVDSKFPSLLRNGQQVAILFDLGAFQTVLRDERMETVGTYVGLMDRAREQGNAIVLVGSVQDVHVHAALAGAESVFRFKTEKGHSLCREMTEILEDPANPFLYREMKRRLGGRCSWLNLFSRENVRRILQRHWLESGQAVPDEGELDRLAFLVSRWYGSSSFRAACGEILRDNALRRFTDLCADLRGAGVMARLQKLAADPAFMEYYGSRADAQGDAAGAWERAYVGELADSHVTEALRRTRLANPFPASKEAGKLRGRLGRMLEDYGSPRVAETGEAILRDIDRAADAVARAAGRGDDRTADSALEVLEYADRKNFLFDDISMKIWKCRTAILQISENISRLARCKEEDQNLIRSYREKKEALALEMSQMRDRMPLLDAFLDKMEAGIAVDYYSETGMQAMEYCRLADRSLKVQDQLKDCMAKLAYHKKAYDQEEDKLEQLNMATRSNLTIRGVEIGQILRDVGEMERVAVEESEKSSARQLYDLKQSIGTLAGADAGGTPNYIDTLRRFRQMRSEESLEAEG